MWIDLWPWLLGALVLFLASAALWLALRRPRAQVSSDLRSLAIERWLAGDLTGARDLLREVVQRHPQDSEPYLHLGTLMRETGDPRRAAALHRSLAVRADLSPARRVTVGLELASDLVELKRWSEADEVLSQLGTVAADQLRWFLLRFAAAIGRNDPDAALTALREGEKRLRGADAASLQDLRAAWLTDRALAHVRAGETDRARDVLGKCRGLAPAAGRTLLVRAMLAAADHDADGAVAAVADGLANHPAEMAPALHLLEGVLLETGRFTRVVPILETACGDESAPPSLWMALARLYEKLDRRADALRLLSSKRGDPRLTPDAAAPYLGLLTSEHPDAAFTRVWNTLGVPGLQHGLQCAVCGRRESEIRWFCPDCLSPDSFVPGPTSNRTDLVRSPAESRSTPPRY